MNTFQWPSQLIDMAEELGKRRTVDLFDDVRPSQLSQSHDGITIDFSKNKITSDVVDELLNLAQARGLEDKIKSMFNGERINTTEDRAVLHTLLRSSSSELTEYADVLAAREKASRFAEQLRQKKVRGATGQTIDTIINIGIGGSDLGPRLLLEAFEHQVQPDLTVHCLSDVDYQHIAQLLNSVDLEKTLFILCSKSFTTWETQANAQLAIQALKRKVSETEWAKHFAGVAVDESAMTAFGILPERQFKIWDFIGGRYSIWSSVGLVARIALGNERVDEFLSGGEAMDKHFCNAPLKQNLPVLLAMVQIWNINFLKHSVFITLPYHHSLARFPDYQQQLEMESNGKAVTLQGESLDYSTCPYLFGQLGLNAQHAFMQLVHQSQHNSYLEFIAVPEKAVSFEDDVAFRSCLAQSRALMTGTDETVDSAKQCPGDRPSTTIVLDEMSPSMLGKLIALYEHKVFVQSVIWGINAFDQFGVELGKNIAKSLTYASHDDSSVDASTRTLIRRFCKS